ncbi:glycoside hydrolase family 30 beta sandwich domain-containing protein [uncultured Bacteroides sp.]|uniref:glycoside hydrolase family 30 protein n=1 Tax=uncultured Bacteroides sp. TaxID=162156 RepID=UPI002AA9335D|nr:glycoside hydrolase family 30 beta sandwich domain-containing protein [uncultured Bacteroides sp.]
MINNKRVTLSLLFYLLITFSACGKEENNSQIKKNPPPPDEPKIEKDITVYVTTATRSFDLTKQNLEFNTKQSMSPATITLNSSVTYQEMDGFGAAVTGSTCYNLMLMKPADRTKFLTETFSHTEGLGFSYIRISIGCSDFSLSEYTCCDQKGIENFALQSEEKNYIIPILKEILVINPTLKILGSPWTCPKWMKVNNLTEKKPYDSWTSGQLNPDYYQDYATYFVKWIQAFAAQGIEIAAITPQNEPLNRGNSASLFMGWKEERDFVKTALGPQLKDAGLTTKIYAFDHNYNYDNVADQKGYPLNIYEDDEAGQYITGAAYHNYGGNRSELNIVHNQRPDKELLFTETSIGTWNSGRDLNTRLLADMEDVALGTVNNWCKGVIVWNLMLDNDRGPNRQGGCQTCYGAVDIGYDYKTITRNSHYYIIGHLSAVVKPGALRIGTTGYTADGIIYAAFKNTDNTYAFVIMNKLSEDKSITINDGTHNFTYKLPAKSVVSYKWNK